ncbi:MAG TPA: hypothetical protein VK157_00065 [Phycisphaerales bacterium]|nr:hypothetical protein [Phycisphaerales bacterium]
MSSENNAQPVTNSIPKTTGMAFVTHFIPGLVIGLLVGALATAFVMPLLEREKVIVPETTPGARSTQPTQDGPQANPAPIDDRAAETVKPAEPITETPAQPPAEKPAEDPAKPQPKVP